MNKFYLHRLLIFEFYFKFLIKRLIQKIQIIIFFPYLHFEFNIVLFLERIIDLFFEKQFIFHFLKRYQKMLIKKIYFKKEKKTKFKNITQDFFNINIYKKLKNKCIISFNLFIYI